MAVPNPVFSCPEAGSIWSSCTFTQMLSAFELALRTGLTEGVIGIGLQILQVASAATVIALCVWLAMSDDDHYLAHIIGTGIKIAILGQVIPNLFDWGMHAADGVIAVGLLIGAPAAAAFGLPTFTLAQFHDPGAILLMGWRLLVPVFDYIENLGMVDSLFHLGTIVLYGLVGILGWACVLWMGLNIVVGWIELMLLLTFGTPLIALRIFEATRFLGDGVVLTVAQAALRMGMFATILSLIIPVLRSLQVTDATDPGWDTILALLGTNLLFGYLCWRADALAARLTGGSAGHVGLGLVFMARQSARAAQAMSGAGAAAGTAASAAASAIRQQAGRPWR